MVFGDWIPGAPPTGRLCRTSRIATSLYGSVTGMENQILLRIHAKRATDSDFQLRMSELGNMVTDSRLQNGGHHASLNEMQSDSRTEDDGTPLRRHLSDSASPPQRYSVASNDQLPQGEDKPQLNFGVDRILALPGKRNHVDNLAFTGEWGYTGSCAHGCAECLWLYRSQHPLYIPSHHVIHAPKPLRPFTNRVVEGREEGRTKRKRSWSRAVFSSLQRKGLEKRFQLQKYITKPDRRQLAATLGLTDAQVKVWFQNRRMKWRHAKEIQDSVPSQQDRQRNNDTNTLPLT